MPIITSARLALAAIGSLAVAATWTPGTAGPASEPVFLAPHRAVYDLKLARTRGSRPIEAVRGRILYDFSGSACEGYALNFRQVSELDSGEGKNALSDLRASTWEDGKAEKFRFNSENVLNDKTVDEVDGHADRKTRAVEVSLRKPRDKSFDVATGVVFPTEHMRRIILAAHEGKTILEFPVYDGSETGEKIYNTLTVIGHPIAPGTRPPNDAAADKPALTGLTRWPVTISYFDKAATAASGEQMPVYSIGFELYENGISRALSLDYNDFVITGEMTSLELKDAKPCP